MSDAVRRKRMSESYSAFVAGLAVSLFLLPAPVRASLVAEVPLADLVAAADVIVVGGISSTRTVANGLSITVTVDRTHKGVVSTPTIEAIWQRVPANLQPGPHYGLWFLTVSKGALPLPPLLILPRESDAGASAAIFIPLSPSLSPWPSLAGEQDEDTGAVPLDRVVQELRTVIRRGDLSLAGPAIAAAVSLLATPEGSIHTHALAPGVTYHRCPTRLLLQELDSLVVSIVEREVNAGRTESLPHELISPLCLVADPVAAPAAARLATSASGSQLADGAGFMRAIRFCAAQAVRNVHSVEMLPTLAALLENDDPEIQYLAVRGFADHANGEPPSRDGRSSGTSTRGPWTTSKTHRNSPSYSVFIADPGRYTSFWRRWWTCEACRLDRGIPTISVGSTGTCNGSMCTITFSADVSDPDGDSVTVSWVGCAEGSDLALSCSTSTPGIVAAHAVVRDSFGERSSAVKESTVYAASYTVSAWSDCLGSGPFACTSSGSNGCARPGTRTRTVAFATLTLVPAEAVVEPPSAESCAETQPGYVVTHAVGPWSACSAPCGGGTRTRAVSESSWDHTPPHATPPLSEEECNTHQCPLTCNDYDMYPTRGQCYGAGWATCEIRYRPDGVGGTLTCWKGFPQ